MLVLLLAVPFAAALVCAFMGRGRRAGWFAMAAMAVDAAILFHSAPAMAAEGGLAARWDWIPDIGLSLALRADGLSLLFASLILGIGLLIFFYAHFYMKSPRDHMGVFFAWMLAFAGSMLGVVFSDNLLLMFLFWEATSVASFFLIGFWFVRPESRTGAVQALLVTGAGGLALLAAFVLMGMAGGAFEWSALLANADTVKESPWYVAILTLFLLGAFTKSAQFPFHFWLPGAMAAPTPVSAYLHSATMVKVGVFALARFFPILGDTVLWRDIVVPVGVLTAILGAYYVFHEWDLKRILAWSTVSQLGVFTALFGMAGGEPAVAPLLQIAHHAAYKCALFLLVGYLDHQTGTRDVRLLGGVWKKFPFAGAFAAVVILSAAGIPPLLGFWSKEAFYATVIAFAEPTAMGRFYVAAAVLVNALTFGYLLRLFMFSRVHANKTPPDDNHRDPEHHGPHPRRLLAAPAILAGVCLVGGSGWALFARPAAELNITGLATDSLPWGVPFWHHLDMMFVMSVAAFALGAFAWAGRATLRAWHERIAPPFTGEDVFAAAYAGTLRGSRRLTEFYQNGRLPLYFLVTFGALGVAALVFLARAALPAAAVSAFEEISLIEGILWSLVAAGSLGTLLFRDRMAAILSLSLAGLAVCGVFVVFKAPDLALTQFLIEVMTLLLVLAAFRVFPQRDAAPRPFRPARTLAAIGAGGISALSVWTVLRGDAPAREAAEFYLASSETLAGSRNVVNAILVDFRGFDTLGEIAVFAAAALGLLALAPAALAPRATTTEKTAGSRSFMLEQSARVILPAALLYAMYLLLRGHHWPGGGFIAGVLAAGAVVLYGLSGGLDAARRALPRNAPALSATGLLISAGTGLAALAWGLPFLTYGHVHFDAPGLGEIHLGGALLFDIGVFLVVVGAALTMLFALHRSGGDETS